MNASIKVTLCINDDTYNINLDIPSTTPTPTAPYKFIVASEPPQGETAKSMLEVAVGDATHYFVGIEPPKNILEIAKIQDTVKSLQVVVAEGEYDPESHTFK